MEQLLNVHLYKTITMKQFCLLLILIFSIQFSQSQNPEYSSLWKQAEKLESEGLPKSALEIVEQIEKKAKADNNKPQVIKSLLFKSKYALILKENAQLSIISDFQIEINANEAPVKNVLENMLASMYWQYFQENRWKFYNRSETTIKVDDTDFRTWDLKTLFKEIQCHYSNSLDNANLLQETKINDFKAIIFEQKKIKNISPNTIRCIGT